MENQNIPPVQHLTQPTQPPMNQQPQQNVAGSATMPVKQVNPGQSMAIGGIILGLVVGAPFGLGISIAALVKSKKAGFDNTLALVFIIIFALLTPFWLFWLIDLIASLA